MNFYNTSMVLSVAYEKKKKLNHLFTPSNSVLHGKNDRMGITINV